jgi:hypothetical protein
MARIYKRSDRIKVQVHDITLHIAPLSLSQKKEIQSHLYKATTEKDLNSAQEASVLSVKYSVKRVEGLYDSNDEEYKLKFDSNDNLSEETIDDLLNIEHSTKISMVCNSFIGGVSKEVIDPETGKPLEGISFPESEKKN